MTFSMGLLVFVAVGSVCILPVLGTTCPADAWDGSAGFDCPRFFDTADESYCCDAGEFAQYCCDIYDYYNYGYLSTGGIIGVVFGCVLLLSLFITSIVACCVCCARAPPRHPVSTHIHTTTVAHRSTEHPAPIITVNAPPGYYTPSVQPAPAHKAPKPGQYQQFQNEPNN